jgi:excisionase family DNA binding protein
VKKQEKTTRLLTVREVAARTGYEHGAIREWANSRRIQHVRLGRVIRIPEDVLEDFIASNTIPAKEE